MTPLDILRASTSNHADLLEHIANLIEFGDEHERESAVAQLRHLVRESRDAANAPPPFPSFHPVH